MTDAEIIAKDLNSTQLSYRNSKANSFKEQGFHSTRKARKVQGGEEWPSKRWSGILCEGFNSTAHVWLYVSPHTLRYKRNHHTSYMKHSWIMDLMIWFCFSHFCVASNLAKSQLCSHGLCTLGIKNWARNGDPKNSGVVGQSWHH